MERLRRSARGDTSTAETISFESDGLSLIGDVHLPASTSSGPSPALVIAPGWGGNRAKSPTRIARDLVGLNVAAFAFDFRGFGDSEGQQHRLFPSEQARDVRAAVASLAENSAIDPQRIYVMGMLTGAAAAIQAAADDQAIAGVVAVFPFGNGERWLRSMRRHWEWIGLEKLLELDRQRRSEGQPSLIVDADEILMRGPETVSVDESGRLVSEADRPSREQRLLTVESAEQLAGCRPEDAVALLSPRPLLVIAVKEDLMVAIEESRSLFDRAAQPKSMIVLDDISHHETFADAHRRSVLEAVAEFVRRSSDV